MRRQGPEVSIKGGRKLKGGRSGIAAIRRFLDERQDHLPRQREQIGCDQLAGIGVGGAQELGGELGIEQVSGNRKRNEDFGIDLRFQREPGELRGAQALLVQAELQHHIQRGGDGAADVGVSGAADGGLAGQRAGHGHLQADGGLAQEEEPALRAVVETQQEIEPERGIVGKFAGELSGVAERREQRFGIILEGCLAGERCQIARIAEQNAVAFAGRVGDRAQFVRIAALNGEHFEAERFEGLDQVAEAQDVRKRRRFDAAQLVRDAKRFVQIVIDAGHRTRRLTGCGLRKVEVPAGVGQLRERVLEAAVQVVPDLVGELRLGVGHHIHKDGGRVREPGRVANGVDETVGTREARQRRVEEAALRILHHDPAGRLREGDDDQHIPVPDIVGERIERGGRFILQHGQRIVNRDRNEAGYQDIREVFRNRGEGKARLGQSFKGEEIACARGISDNLEAISGRWGKGRIDGHAQCSAQRHSAKNVKLIVARAGLRAGEIDFQDA